MQKFIGHCGNSMSENNTFYFAEYFDWVMMSDTIKKKINIPKTIYIKTDYLTRHLNEILNLKNDFILISGCSDYSPQVNFNMEYNKIINMPNLLKWYAENNISNHIKMYSLTVGFATHKSIYESTLLNIRKQNNQKIHQIFCCWRNRYTNVCGDYFIERTHMVEFIHNYPEIFYYKEDIPTSTEYQETLSKYKWCLCPLGNGVDCAPKIIECFFLKTIPIVKKTFNNFNLYNKYPVVWVDNFIDILNMQLYYDENINWDSIIEEFTCDYWYKKIIE